MFACVCQNVYAQHKHSDFNIGKFGEEECVKCKHLGYSHCMHKKNTDTAIYIVPQVDPTDSLSNNTCNKYLPFCADGVYKFETTFCPNHIVGSSNTCAYCEAQDISPASYGCLRSQPRPAWFCMKVKNPGQLYINVIADDPSADIDIAIWGPFDSPTEACFNHFENAPVPIACSYSTDYNETMHIASPVVGKYYMMVITNYRNILTDVTISLLNAGQEGAGELDCNIVYNCSLLSVSTTPEADSCGYSYNLSGYIDFTNPPDSTRLCVINTAVPGDTFFINPPLQGLSKYAYFFNNVPYGGTLDTITAWFENDTACYLSKQFVPPARPIPQFSITGGTACSGDTVDVKFNFLYSCIPFNFVYTTDNGATYDTVKNYSSLSYIVRETESKTYRPVAIWNADTVGNVIGSANVRINPRPQIDTLQDAKICSGTYTFASGLIGSSYKYQWTNLTTNTNVSSENKYTASVSGTYALSVTNRSTLCSSYDTATLTIYSQSLATLVATPDSVCPGDSLVLTATSTSSNITGYNFFKNSQFVKHSTSNIYSEGNFAATATYSAQVVCTYDTLVCPGKISDSIIVKRITVPNPTLNLPSNKTSYKNASCVADTTVATNGIATIVYGGCQNAGNTILSHTDSIIESNDTTIISRIWVAENIYTHQKTTRRQTITLLDTIKPTFTAPADVTIYRNNACFCDSTDATNGRPTTVSDNCDYSPLVTFVDAATDTLIVRTWTVTDASGNSRSKQQRIVILDTIAPEITTDPNNLILECDGTDNNSQIQLWLAANGNAAARDCSPAIVWTNNYDSTAFVTDASCVNNLNQTVTFTATDARGNSSSRNAIVKIRDTQKPYFVTYPEDLNLNCDNPANATLIQAWLAANGGFSAADKCSDTIVYTNNYADLSFDPSNDCNVSKVANVSFMATDECGNVLTVSAKINIKKHRQNIIIDEDFDRVYGAAPYLVMAVSTSYLPVDLNVVSGTSIRLDSLQPGRYLATIQHVGTTTLEATQNGNDSINPAPSQMFDVVISPAVLKVSVRDEYVLKGDTIPAFLIIYKGFVYNETDSILNSIPTAGSDATSSSPQGLYTIYVDGAMADNYIIEYYNGTLEIAENMTKYLPNAFTPFDADGINDVFAPGYEIKIFNINGSLMYQGNDGWDGTYRKTGKLVAPGVYYYVLKYSDDIIFKGSVDVLKN